MLIDIHMHTSVGSQDSRLRVGELFEQARSRGVDAVCVTEHDSFESAEQVANESSVAGMLAIQGVEISTDRGDILAYGVDGSLFAEQISLKKLFEEFADREMASRNELDRHIARLAPGRSGKASFVTAEIHKRGGAIVLAHPFGMCSPFLRNFRFYALALAASEGQTPSMSRLLRHIEEVDPELLDFAGQLDAIEIWNGTVALLSNVNADALRSELGKPGTGGSDAHERDYVGICATEIDGEIDGSSGLVEALRQGKTRGVVMMPAMARHRSAIQGDRSFL